MYFNLSRLPSKSRRLFSFSNDGRPTFSKTLKIVELSKIGRYRVVKLYRESLKFYI